MKPPPAEAGAAPQALAFRGDIEGLRGVAVLSVLAVHAFPQVLRGGFIGVDIFFVLSGFLISAIVRREVEAGSFSLPAFYARRMRRLLPTLCLVLLACLALAAWAAFPALARQVGKHAVASAVFAANLVLWTEAGYFEGASETKPLLHLWSLGIEEQFYLLWPSSRCGCSAAGAGRSPSSASASRSRWPSTSPSW